METTPQCTNPTHYDSFDDSENGTLLPGLPDDLAPSLLFSLFAIHGVASFIFLLSLPSSPSMSFLLLCTVPLPQTLSLEDPLVFHPESNSWFYGPPISTPRRWCVTGSARGVVYMASGVGSHYQGDIARSMERWDLNKKRESWGWENKAPLKDGRFSREEVEAVGYRGKLCMVNVKGNAVKEGAVYDVELDKWEEMPQGMVAGWNGPAATMDEDVIYVIDEVKGRLSKYDGEKDCWEKVIELEQLKRAEQITAGRGKICAISAKGERIIVVDVRDKPARFWEVAPPPGMEVVAVHVLPRMISRQH
ncbi:F-box/kelch-repeat protein SKIP25-like [Gossypium australe]|uniref:F-box/kelch-repeat protein SKIP25-like n=1 Tax=Gossypium australe TaxID=47621 RepID=A0A5B6W4T9_9ROSI|nr:F-box/kelch-repeat protein SKIP25-like [Gossypium australe]